MAVAFNNMPGNIRVPGAYFEVNAGVPPYSGLSRTLLIGRKTSAGSAEIGKVVNLGSGDPNALFGAGSMLADMALYARQHNPIGEIWLLPVTDPSGTAASGSIAITGTATAAGTLVRYVAGERYSVGVAVGDTAATVATALKAAIDRGYTKFNRAMSAPVTTAVSTGTVTLTARHVGTEGNGIRIEAGLDGDEIDPAGLTVTITPMSGGTGDVDLAAALAALGDAPFDHIGSPYVSASQLNAVRDFLSDSGTGRWAPTVGLMGHNFTAFNGNLAAQTALGQGRNDQHTSILGLNNYPHPSWCWVAALVGVVGLSKDLGRLVTEAVEIARPLQTLVLQGLRGPKAASDQWKMADRQSLYSNGISAVTFRADGQAAIDRVVTTYRTNAWGQPDITYLDVETMYIAMYAARYFKQRILATYPRHVLKDENPRKVQGIVTPPQIKATLIHAYRELFDAGLAEKPELFAQFVIVERSGDPNRVNAYIPFDVANQLRVFAANVTIFPELNSQIAALQ
ncbi:phage tail sheath subtilisin-like domain-containing protein [Microvirga arsenatis]|uniref:Phage tail protein n=1 Tax=Microvirga arsenatis TaxID=2692265 RepID=A0ABW9Z1K0_9HYPH|nr:phage tail sheath subtilisin-like domain-containing protein [Microvirga arsenatis]NBJ13204.1 phage tail protein [Microvirga arsenatis]NBJ25158.1 phage tail protein [Microvirga arsenatis]